MVERARMRESKGREVAVMGRKRIERKMINDSERRTVETKLQGADLSLNGSPLLKKRVLL